MDKKMRIMTENPLNAETPIAANTVRMIPEVALPKLANTPTLRP